MKFEAVNDHMSTTRVKGSMFEDKDPDMKETLYEQLQSIGFRAATLQRCLETAMLKLAKKFLFSHHRQTRTRHPTLTVRGRQHSRQPPCSVEHLVPAHKCTIGYVEIAGRDHGESDRPHTHRKT